MGLSRFVLSTLDPPCLMRLVTTIRGNMHFSNSQNTECLRNWLTLCDRSLSKKDLQRSLALSFTGVTGLIAS